MRPRVEREAGEIRERLQRQYRYLCRSAGLFDTGAEDEAPRLALCCRVLFHDHGASSKSIVGQIDARGTLRLPDTAMLDRLSIAPGIAIQLGGIDADGNENDNLIREPRGGLAEFGGPADDPRWVAPLDGREPQRWLDLDQWLSEAAIRGTSGTTHSRWDIIRVLANQEGGGHVDPTIDAEYAALRVDTLGALVGPPIIGEMPETLDLSQFHAPAKNLVEASMRQIAHEAIHALEKAFPYIAS